MGCRQLFDLYSQLDFRDEATPIRTAVTRSRVNGRAITFRWYIRRTLSGASLISFFGAQFSLPYEWWMAILSILLF